VPRIPIKLAAAALVAGVAVAACAPVKLGAAAIVGSQRITTTSLAQEVSNLSNGYQAYKNQIQLQYPVSEMPQQVLAWLVRFQVRDRLAQREGIMVTPAQGQQAIAAITAQIKQSGSSATLAQIAVANGLPPDQLPALGRYQAIQTALLNRLDGGKLPTATAEQQALQARFNGSQCLAAKSLDIQINPQFGLLDYSTFAIVPAQTTLSRGQGSPAPSPSASAPQLTPPC
jgi:peptidyl-prolyl cis-trans isomerase SurA